MVKAGTAFHAVRRGTEDQAYDPKIITNALMHSSAADH